MFWLVSAYLLRAGLIRKRVLLHSANSSNFNVTDRMKWFAGSLEPTIAILEQALEQKESTYSKMDDVASLAKKHE